MKNKTKFGLVIAATVTLISSCLQDIREIVPEDSPADEECKVKSIVAIGEGSFPQWSAKNNLIAFNKKINDVYEILTMNPNGSDIKCFTCGKLELPQKGHKGQPAWHPSGEYIVFTVENTTYPKLRLGLNAYPDCGRNHNVWIMSADGSKFWQMTDYKENWGVIRPRFSPNGALLFWSEEWSMEKYPGKGSVWSVRRNPRGEELGLWRIKLADISFSPSGEPVLFNPRTILHKGLALLEGSGLTPDNKQIHFSAVPLTDTRGIALWGEIYISDLDGGNLLRLTNSPYQHDENSEVSLGGNKTVWSHSDGLPGESVELYIMDIDGKNKARLTNFTDFIKSKKHRCNEVAWSYDGKQIMFAFGKGSIQNEISTIYMLTFEGPCGNPK